MLDAWLKDGDEQKSAEKKECREKGAQCHAWHILHVQPPT